MVPDCVAMLKSILYFVRLEYNIYIHNLTQVSKKRLSVCDLIPCILKLSDMNRTSSDFKIKNKTNKQTKCSSQSFQSAESQAK